MYAVVHKPRDKEREPQACGTHSGWSQRFEMRLPMGRSSLLGELPMFQRTKDAEFKRREDN